MKKYESPKVLVISRNDLDIICTSELLFPIIPLSGNTIVNTEEDA